MSQLTRIVLRWAVIEVLAVYLIDHLISPVLIYPASWVIYALAGREAARRCKTWHGLVAGGTVPIIENLAWFAQGAPGHADTSDLPVIIAALTYVTLVVGMVVIGIAFGTVGAVFGRLARLRAHRKQESAGVSYSTTGATTSSPD